MKIIEAQDILISMYSTGLDLIEIPFFRNIFAFLHEGHRTILIYGSGIWTFLLPRINKRKNMEHWKLSKSCSSCFIIALFRTLLAEW